jgi:hypothetical protein
MTGHLSRPPLVGTHAGLSWPEEAREVLKFQIRKRSDRQIEIQPQFTQIGDKIIGSTQWLGADGRRRERFQVLTVRDRKIVDMQGVHLPTPGGAVRTPRNPR